MNERERVYLDSDHDARLAGEWVSEEADADDAFYDMRVAAYCVLCLAMLVAGALVVAVVRALGQ